MYSRAEKAVIGRPRGLLSLMRKRIHDLELRLPGREWDPGSEDESRKVSQTQSRASVPYACGVRC